MYKVLLILKYLRRKLAPIFALLAVAMCTAMVIIVISIMGGFLEMMRTSVQRLSSDVTIVGDVTGFPDYEQLMAMLAKLPEVQSSTPVLQTFGLVNLQGDVITAEVMGIRPEELDKVTRYRDTLQWSADDLVKDIDRTYPPDPSRSAEDQKRIDALRFSRSKYDLKTWGMTLQVPDVWMPENLDTGPAAKKAARPRPVAGAVPGIHVSRATYRDSKGQYNVMDSSVSARLSLTVLPLTQRGTLREPEVRDLIVVNEFKSGLYEIDANRVYVPFDLLQKMMKLEPHPEVDPETGEPTGKTASGRTSVVMVRSQPGVPLEELRSKVITVIRQFLRDHPDAPALRVMTWRERHGTFLNAVEKEKGLLTFLFAFISLVAVVMIAVIFYMIVLEKTRDIGTLRAIGASQSGIASIFLGYGLAIGIIGAAAGFGLAAAIVWNINEIQDFLGTQLGVTALYAGSMGIVLLLLGLLALTLALWRGEVGSWIGWVIPSALLLTAAIVFIVLRTNETLGPQLNSRLRFVMWDPQIYYFDRVPGRMDPTEVTVILILAVISSLLGSLIPALLAARLNPVESLRYE